MKAVFGDEAPLLPVLRGPDPKVVVVLDTSGSMGDGKRGRLRIAASELMGVANASGQTIHALAVDSAVHETRRVRNAADLHALMKGGGGTDMEVGVRAAASSRLGADVIILITDGETGWWGPRDIRTRAPVVVIVANETRSAFERMPPHLRRGAVYVDTNEEGRP